MSESRHATAVKHPCLHYDFAAIPHSFVSLQVQLVPASSDPVSGEIKLCITQTRVLIPLKGILKETHLMLSDPWQCQWVMSLARLLLAHKKQRRERGGKRTVYPLKCSCIFVLYLWGKRIGNTVIEEFTEISTWPGTRITSWHWWQQLPELGLWFLHESCRQLPNNCPAQQGEERKVMVVCERPVQSTHVGVKSTLAWMGTGALGPRKLRKSQTPTYPKDILFGID